MGLPPTNAEEVDVSASIDSTLLELELERARASLKAAAAVGGGTSSIAAAISAAAAAVHAGGGPLPTVHGSAGGLGLPRPAPDLIALPTPFSGGGGGGLPQRPGVASREPSFGGFGVGTSAGQGNVPGFSASQGQPQSSLRQSATAGGLYAVPSSGSVLGSAYPPPPLPAQSRYSSATAAAPLPGPPVSARADAFQASVGALGDVSAFLTQQPPTAPMGAVGGAGASVSAGGVGRGSVSTVGLTGYVHSMQHTQAAFTVERTALEARCRAAEEAAVAAERRHAMDMERVQGRIVALESSLAAERQLCGQLQQQLQAELQRLRAATEAESAARAAEAAAREMLTASNQSLDLERQRAAEAAQQAADAARDLNSRIASMEADRAAAEKQLQQEKEHSSQLYKQLRDAQRQEQALLEKLGASEGARQQQEMRLEAAAEQVTAMRGELQLLNAKLAARDKQLLKHVQEVEETQLAALRSELAGMQSRLQHQEGLYTTLRGSLAAVHQALGPQALAATFGYSESLLEGFTASAAEYGAVADRLLSQRVVLEEDAAAVVQRVKDLVTQARNLYMTSERREVALTAEMDQAMSALRQTNMDAEARLASCNTALRTVTQRVEELTAHVQESRTRCKDLETALAAAQQAKQVERRRCEELQGTFNELQQELSALRVRVADAEGAQRELAASREQAVQLQHHVTELQQQVAQLSALAQQGKEAAESKDNRIRELRAALTSALGTASAAEGQTGALMQEKQQVLDALESERRRCASLEAVVQVTEQQLYKVRLDAETTETAYRTLCQQVVEAAKETASHAKDLQQAASLRSSLAPPRASPDDLARAAQETAMQLATLEAVMEGWTRAANSARGAGGLGPGGAQGVLITPQEHDIPQACTRIMLGHIRRLSTQQELALHQLVAAHQHLQGATKLTAGGQPQSPPGGGAASTPTASPSPTRDDDASVLSLPLQELARRVATAAGETLQALHGALERAAAGQHQVNEVNGQLAQVKEQAELAAQLKEQLTACEAELQHVKAKAQAEFGRVQGEVTKAFQAAEQVQEDAIAEADARVRAAELTAAEALAHAQAQTSAVEAVAEARIRDAEAARTAAVALVTSLQEELASARALLDTARAELKAAQAEHALTVKGLGEQLRGVSEEVAKWRKAAAPRNQERLVLLATLRVLRRKRSKLQDELMAAKHRATKLGAAAESRRDRIKQGMVQLRQLQIDNVQLSSRLQEAESKLARADTLVSRLEERRINVEQDRKTQVEKANKLAGQLADANKALEAARKAEAAARKEVDRLVREQLEPQQRRTATVLEELEGAAGALQESQANATRLLQQGETLRSELAAVKRAAEEESQRAQGKLAAVSRDVADRDALIATLRQQVTAAQAAAAAAAALLPAISSGQLGDAGAVQAHLIGQLGQLQAANAEIEARRTAVETELEVLRVRLGHAEASIARASTPVADPALQLLHTPRTTAATSPAVQVLSRALGDVGGGPPSLVAASPRSTAPSGARDDALLAGMGTPFARDVDPALLSAKDQRIHELRAALSSVMTERGTLQRELAAVREEATAAAVATGKAAVETLADLEAQAARIRQLEEELHRSAASLQDARGTLAATEKQLVDATAAAQLRLEDELRAAEGRRVEDLDAAQQKAEQRATAREEWWQAEVEAREKSWRERLEAAERQARLHLEKVRAEASEQVAALQRRLQEETAALEKRTWEAERSAADSLARGEERTRQAEMAREQLSQMQALHASAEETVRQLSAQLRELQQGNSSQAQAAAAEAAQLQVTADTLRLELALAKDAVESHEAEIRRLQAQNEAAASQARALAAQLQSLSDDLSAARARIGALQQELAEQKTEGVTMRQANEALQASLAAAEERHVDSEAQLVEAEAALSRQQGLVRQVQAENERLHEQYNQLQQQLQQLTAERRLAAAAASASVTSAMADRRSPTKGSPSPLISPSAPERTDSPNSHAGITGGRTRGGRAPVSALESRLLEAAFTDLQTKYDSLQRELTAAEARARQAEHDAQLLRMDLDGANSRLRAAESKATDLQDRLQMAMSGTAQGVGALKERVLELELQLDEQRDREEAAHATLARANTRCNELQLMLADAERRAEELQHRCEDRELEVGVLQAQLASAAAQRLAQQAEAQQAGEAIGSGQVVAAALEIQAREQALLVEALQADLQATRTRAEAAEREVLEQKSAVEALRAEVAALERQRQAAAREAQAAAESGLRVRADSTKLEDRLTDVEKELLQAQEARDKAFAQARAAEARLAEERSEAESLRRQLEAATSQGRGADSLWLQRVADLERALATARQQVAESEDAVVEAAAAQVRSAGLETRARDLEAALAEAETRVAAAAEAEARAAAALTEQKEADRQQITALQLQVLSQQEKLVLCDRQVADRDARLEGVGKQLAALGAHTEVFEPQLREVRQELRAALQENEALQRKLASFVQEVTEGGRRATQHNDAASISGASISAGSHAPQQQLVGMLSENRDLLEKLTTTHSKLKQAKAKLAQWEQELRSKDLEVERLRAQVAAAGGGTQEAGAMSAAATIDVDTGGLMGALRSELEAYKAALTASQEEAAASAAAAAEAHARCEALTQRLQQESERRASHSQASARVVELASPSMLERLQQRQAGNGDTEDGATIQALSQKVRAQRSEIDSLATELQTANAKRTELAREAASLDQRLAEAEIRERDLASTVDTLRQQLVLAQQQLESRQAMLRHLTSASQQQPQRGQKNDAGSVGPPSPGSLASQSLHWGTTGAGVEGLDEGPPSASTSPRTQATRLYHTTLRMSPTRSSTATGTAAAGLGRSLSQQQLLLAQQHQQQATKLDRVVAMWRDACRAKDARVQELQADLTTFSSALERARADASALTAKVLEREQALSSCQQQLELTRESLGAQLRAAEDKLDAKAQQLMAVEDELQGREQELRDVRAQLQGAQRSILVLQAEGEAHRESATKAAADLAAAAKQVATLQAEVLELQQRSSAARHGAQHMTDQVQQLQDQIGRAEGVVGRLLVAVRTTLSNAANAAASQSVQLRSSFDDSGGASGNLPTSLRLLEELSSVLMEELQRRSTVLVKAEAEATSLQAQLAAREEDVKRLEARLKSAQDSLAARLDEVSRLQTALRRKEADCEAVETEIAAQIADYQRLKQRLLQQERDSTRLSVDQEVLLRRGDELEAALAAKQEECALLMKKCAQLEEQWQAGRSAMAALQERSRSLEAQSEALQRNHQAATLARQDAAASLDGARAELRAAAQQAAAYREQLEMRNNEIRELNAMFQAWEAMRLGKDAQIAALLERCKRHEEDAAEKARTVDALRRKLQAVTGAAVRSSHTGTASGVVPAGSPGGSLTTTPMNPMQQQQQPRPTGSGGARHIHVHMHSPAMTVSPTTSGVSGTGSNMGR